MLVPIVSFTALILVTLILFQTNSPLIITGCMFIVALVCYLITYRY
jgi:hypothetical protein